MIVKKHKIVKKAYSGPAIIQKGRLSQFAGSPLGKSPWNPLNLPPQ